MTGALRMAFQALAANKLRSSLTMLGNIIGVTCVVALINIGNSGREEMMGALSEIGQNLVFVRPRYDPDADLSRRWRPLDLRDAEAILRNCPTVAHISPVDANSGKVVFGKNNRNAQIEGVWASYFELSERKLARGAYFTPEDVNKGAKVCLLGSKLVEELFGSLDALGQTVRINNQPFVVVGLFAPKGSSLGGPDQDTIANIPITTGQQRLSGNRHIDYIKATARVREDIPKMKDEIRAAVRVSHRLPANKRDDIEIDDLGSIAQSFDQFLLAITALLSAIAGISLLVGGIGIMNIMLVSVTERTREIGLRMAVGALETDILLQFLVEAVVLSLFGGMIGVAVGLAISSGTSVYLEWPVVISMVSVVLAVVFSGCVGIFFGLYPAWRASRLDPIVALRHE